MKKRAEWHTVNHWYKGYFVSDKSTDYPKHISWQIESPGNPDSKNPEEIKLYYEILKTIPETRTLKQAHQWIDQHPLR